MTFLIKSVFVSIHAFLHHHMALKRALEIHGCSASKKINFHCLDVYFKIFLSIRNLNCLVINCMRSLKGLNLFCVLDLRVILMTEIYFNTICNITQEPQDLQRWCLVFRFSVKSNKILLHQFMSKQVSVHRGLLFDQLAIANTIVCPELNHWENKYHQNTNLLWRKIDVITFWHKVM